MGSYRVMRFQLWKYTKLCCMLIRQTVSMQLTVSAMLTVLLMESDTLGNRSPTDEWMVQMTPGYRQTTWMLYIITPTRTISLLKPWVTTFTITYSIITFEWLLANLLYCKPWTSPICACHEWLFLIIKTLVANVPLKTCRYR